MPLASTDHIERTNSSPLGGGAAGGGGLLQHFRELTLHPKNAQELKGLILQLAIQGKLTAQWRKENPNVEPASVLLEKIAAEKKRLIKEKKFKKENPLPPVENDEIPYQAPSKWRWYRLREVGFTMTGGTPSKSNSNFFGDDIPFIKPGDIKDWHINYNNEGLTKLGQANLDRTAPKGSILMVCLGTIGKCAIVEKDCTFNQQINSISPILVSSEYLLDCLSSKYFYDVAWEKSTSTTIALLNKGKWESIPIPIPPLEEQKAIVAIVNQLFAEVEQLEALTQQRIQLKEDFVTSALHRLTTEDTSSAWAFLQPHFHTFFTEQSSVKKLRESMLQLAVQGKLTAKWREENPNIEPASSLLRKFKRERAQLIEEKKIRKEQPLPQIEESEIEFDVPRTWVATRLGEIGDWGAGATPLRSRSEFYGGDINWFKSGELNNGIMDYDSEEKINELALKGSSLRLNQVGDVLIAMYGATIGKTGILAVDGTTNQAVCACTPFDGMFNRYLHLSLRALNQVFTSQGEGGAQPNISRVKIRLQPFLLPPLEEQKAIVQQVNALMALCDNLENEIQTRETTLEQWMQSWVRGVSEN